MAYKNLLRHKATLAKWRAANKEKIQHQARENYLAHKEERKERNYELRRIWGLKNKTRLKTYRTIYKTKRSFQIKAWQERNRERHKAGIDLWYQNNKERRHAADKAWRSTHRASCLVYYKRYREKNPHAWRKHDRARRARKLGCPQSNLDLMVDWENRWKKKGKVRCYWCGNSFNPATCHMDHIVPLAKGGPHRIENLCISCQPCNNHKSAKPLPKWSAELTQPVLHL